MSCPEKIRKAEWSVLFLIESDFSSPEESSTVEYYRKYALMNLTLIAVSKSTCSHFLLQISMIL